MITVYADILFLINLIMMLFILYCTGLFLKAKPSALNLVFGAIVASGGYCLIALWDKLLYLRNIPGYLFLELLTIYITYMPKNIKLLLKLWITVNCFAFFIGGLISALFYYTNIGRSIGDNIAYSISRMSFKLILSSTALSYIVIKTVYSIFRSSVMKKQIKYSVEIILGEKKATFTAIGDTGNSLKDCVTDQKVIITEFDVIKDILPEPELITRDLYTYITVHGNKIQARLIPYKSLGNENGLLFCFKPHRVYIDGAEYTEIMIGVSFMKLSDKGSFKGLINTEIFAAGEVNNNADKAA